MFDDDHYLNRTIKPLVKIWLRRLQGVSVVIGFIMGFISNHFDIDIFLVSQLLSGLFLALGFWIIPYILFIPIQILWFITDAAIESASEQGKPFWQGAHFIWFFFMMLGVLDLMMGGTFIIQPIISLLLDGNLNASFWGCDDWVSVEEGSYCAD